MRELTFKEVGQVRAIMYGSFDAMDAIEGEEGNPTFLTIPLKWQELVSNFGRGKEAFGGVPIHWCDDEDRYEIGYVNKNGKRVIGSFSPKWSEYT